MSNRLRSWERSRNDEFDPSYWNGRFICDVLQEMRDLDKSKNYGSLDGLISEAQSMANRMESSLGQKKDLIKMREDWSRGKKIIKRLKKRHDELLERVRELETLLPEESGDESN